MLQVPLKSDLFLFEFRRRRGHPLAKYGATYLFGKSPGNKNAVGTPENFCPLNSHNDIVFIGHPVSPQVNAIAGSVITHLVVGFKSEPGVNTLSHRVVQGFITL